MADVAVIVPVLGRPHHAKTFMESLRANTPKGAVQVYAVPECQPIDTGTTLAWQCEPNVCVMEPDAGTHTFAQKVAWAYENTDEPYLLLVGSDVVFHPWWFQRAMKVAAKGFGLVATNDLGNRAVMEGRHATHPLIARRYVEEKGASWDGPGHIVHTGYGHCFIDNEWSVKAIMDGEFAFARTSVIEHAHPYWGKAEMDDTYRKGEATVKADELLFRERCKKYAGLVFA